MVEAYSDSSRKNSKVASSAIVVTEDMYVDSIAEINPDSVGSHVGELEGMIMAMRIVNDNIEYGEVVNLYSDCESLVDELKCYLNKTKRLPAPKDNELWVELINLCSNYKLSPSYTKAHLDTVSCNTFCDIVSRLLA